MFRKRQKICENSKTMCHTKMGRLFSSFPNYIHSLDYQLLPFLVVYYRVLSIKSYNLQFHQQILLFLNFQMLCLHHLIFYQQIQLCHQTVHKGQFLCQSFKTHYLFMCFCEIKSRFVQIGIYFVCFVVSRNKLVL